MTDHGRIQPWLLLAALALALSPLAFLHPVRISGRSMEPLLHDGDLRLAVRAWCAGRPEPAQVWLIRTDAGPAVKRVSAGPGAQVELRDGELWVDARPVPEPYVRQEERASAGPWATGTGYFLLGDNRPQSHDSRAWGALDRQRLEARIWVW